MNMTNTTTQSEINNKKTEDRKAYAREYYRRNRERILNRNKERQKKKTEKVNKTDDKKAYAREYYLRNREKILSRNKERYQKNSDKIKKYQREYFHKHVDEYFKAKSKRIKAMTPEEKEQYQERLRHYARKYYQKKVLNKTEKKNTTSPKEEKKFRGDVHHANRLTNDFYFFF